MNEVNQNDHSPTAGGQSDVPSNRGQLKGIISLESLATTLLIFCVAFVGLTPLDVLERYPELVPYVDWLASWNPHVHRLGLKQISGQYADANRFCAAVMWVVWTPLVILHVIGVYFFNGFKDPESLTNKELTLGVFIGAILAYLALYTTGDINSSTRIGQFMVSNPLGRSLFIPSCVLTFLYSIILFVLSFRHALGRFLDFNQK